MCCNIIEYKVTSINEDGVEETSTIGSLTAQEAARLFMRKLGRYKIPSGRLIDVEPFRPHENDAHRFKARWMRDVFTSSQIAAADHICKLIHRETEVMSEHNLSDDEKKMLFEYRSHCHKQTPGSKFEWMPTGRDVRCDTKSGSKMFLVRVVKSDDREVEDFLERFAYDPSMFGAGKFVELVIGGAWGLVEEGDMIEIIDGESYRLYEVSAGVNERRKIPILIRTHNLPLKHKKD